MKWVGIASTRPLRFSRRADNPQPNHYQARAVQFGLSGWSWCAFAIGGQRVLMPNGRDAITHEARLASGHVVGLRDLATCDYSGNVALINEWRGSLADVIERELDNANETEVRP